MTIKTRDIQYFIKRSRDISDTLNYQELTDQEIYELRMYLDQIDNTLESLQSNMQEE